MLFLLLACEQEISVIEDAETEWILDIEVSASEAVPTALEVRFSTAEKAIGWVEFGQGSADALSTLTTEAGTTHAAAVIGNPALTEVTMRVVAEVDGERHESGTFTFETGQLLPETPLFDITVNDYDAPAGTAMMMSVFGDVNYLVMMDLDGTITWSLAQGVEDELYGLSMIHQGDTLVYNLLDIGNGGGGTLVSIDLLGNRTAEIDTPLAHHFITAGPEGGLVWLVDDVRDVEGTEIVGDAVMHYSTGGEESVLFSGWDNFTLPPFSPNKKHLDWTHGNWIQWNADRESYLFCNAFTNTIVEFDIDGIPLRTMGGPGAQDSEYVFGSEEQAFEYPHGPHWADNGELLVFSTTDDISRVIRYEVDDDGAQLNEVWSYGEDLGYESLWLGEVQELPDGNLLICWGSVGLLQIVSPDGELLWEATASFQTFVNQVLPLSSPYAPWE